MTRVTYFHIASFVVLLFMCTGQGLFAQDFLHASGNQIVNGANQPQLLRGVCLGGWLVPEGYMLLTSDFAKSPTEIRNKIEALIGTANANAFYTKYYSNFVTRQDIAQLASSGFNSIRLPIHYSVLTPKETPFVYSESGFTLIDSLLKQCEDNHLYLFLELHCAPGGQNNQYTSDYDASSPSLWQDTVNQRRTVELWKTIAQRYAGRQWIGGYDLLNECSADLGSNNEILRDYYIRITNAIREVDNNHMIIIEGNNYSTDFTGLTPAWDVNMSYSFHKYWDAVTPAAIASYITLREQSGRPLWMGESGENVNTWYTDCVKLLEQNNIGWAWWTYKKVESNSGLCRIKKPVEYETLLQYWKGLGPQPTVEYAVAALDKLADNLLLQNAFINSSVIDAVLREPGSEVLKPFAANAIPGTLYAANYDYGKTGIAYADQDSSNAGGQYRNDGVDIELCTDSKSNGYNVGWIASDEFLKYTVNIEKKGTYTATMRVASAAGGSKIQLKIDGNNTGPTIDVPSTGSFSTWSDVVIPDITLPQGVHVLTITFPVGGFNLTSMNFVFTSPIAIDGLINEPEYTGLASWNGAANWSPSNQLGSIKYYTDGNRMYVGISGIIEQNWNKLLLLVNFSGYNGIPKDNPNSIPSGFNGFFQGLAGTQFGMETDYAFSWTCNSGTPLYCDAQRYGSSTAIQGGGLGSSDQSGNPTIFAPASIEAGLGGTTGDLLQAYRNDFNRTTNVDHGLEFCIDISAFPGITNAQTVSFFVIIANNDGTWLSNQTLPDYHNTGLFNGDFGNHPNISWLQWNAQANQGHPEVVFSTQSKSLTPMPYALTVTELLESMWNGTSTVRDTITAELHSATSPFSLIDTAKAYSTNLGVLAFTFEGLSNGIPYYLVMKHKNALETWSSSPITFTDNGTTYDFTTAATQAYGSNLLFKNGKWCVYVGDVDHSGFVDNNDLLLIDNDAFRFVSGYASTDLDGSQYVDNGDLLYCDNNAFNFVHVSKPSGAASTKKSVSRPPLLMQNK